LLLQLVTTLAIDVEQAILRRYQARDVPDDGVNDLRLEFGADAAM
jgi:hypothetical protein